MKHYFIVFLIAFFSFSFCDEHTNLHYQISEQDKKILYTKTIQSIVFLSFGTPFFLGGVGLLGYTFAVLPPGTRTGIGFEIFAYVGSASMIAVGTVLVGLGIYNMVAYKKLLKKNSLSFGIRKKGFSVHYAYRF